MTNSSLDFLLLVELGGVIAITESSFKPLDEPEETTFELSNVGETAPARCVFVCVCVCVCR